MNTNTGYFGLCIRSALRYDDELRQWIKHTTLDCSHEGSTVVKLNGTSTRLELNLKAYSPRASIPFLASMA